MLTPLYYTFRSRRDAQRCLTEFRKAYRVALRGACITGPDYFNEFTIHAPLGGTGFSNAELSAALRCICLDLAHANALNDSTTR